MKVVLNSLSITYPMSGVGQYTLMLGETLKSLLGKYNVLWYGRKGNKFENQDSEPFLVLNSFQKFLKKILREIPYGRPFIFNLRNKQFRSYVRKVKPNLYHETNYALFDFDNGPTIVTLYDLSFVRHPEWHPNDRVKYFEKYCLKKLSKTHAIITISEFSKKEILELLGIQRGKIHVIPPGVDRRFRPEGEKLKGFPKDYILYVGNLEPRKNLPFLIDAYQMLPPKIKDKHSLVISGAFGWHCKELKERLNSLIGKENVIITGYVSQNLLPNLYRGAALFIYPSLYEGFGLPLLEAMACGIPVIATNTAAIPEVVRDAGLLIEPNNMNELVEGILNVLESKEKREEMKKKGLERSQEFLWGKFGQQILEVYEQCLTKKRGD